MKAAMDIAVGRPPKASDITDEALMAAFRASRGRHGVPRWATLWDIQAEMPQWPPKVVQAKLRSMVKRKLLEGCACGCRGDFEDPATADHLPRCHG